MLFKSRSISSGIFLGISIFIFNSSHVFAQATLEKRAIAPVDICADDDPNTASDGDASSCAQDAMFNDNTPAFFKWAQIAAAKGDYVVADWIAEKFVDRHQFIFAYMWYDIAAQFHANEIRQQGPGTSPLEKEDNGTEIGWRDGVAQEYHLTAADKASAMQSEKAWLAAHVK